MPKDTLPDWELVLAAAARLQDLIPGTVLVGKTASALYAGHRFSRDADHILDNLSSRFDQVLSEHESALQQLMIQLANPLPYDLEETELP